MPVRSVSNPHQATKPLRQFGALKIDNSGGMTYNGQPYIGPVLDFKESDPPEYLPKQCFNACVAQLDLSIKADMDQYRAIGQKVCNGGATLSFEEKIYDNDIKSWRVLVRWMEPYMGPPDIVKSLQAEKAVAGKQKVAVLPETDLRKPRDLAEVKAEEAAARQGIDPDGKSRYSSIDDLIHSFGANPDGDDDEQVSE